MKASKIREKLDGFALIELLITILLLIFVVIGLTKGVYDFMGYLKGARINSRAKELGEYLRSEMVNRSTFEELKNCFNPQIEGTLDISGTFSFDNSSFYTKNCTHVCTDRFACLYCYRGEELFQVSGTNATNCPGGGYPIRVGYNSALVVHYDSETGEKKEMGIAIGLRIYFNETKTKREKEIKYLIFKKNES